MSPEALLQRQAAELDAQRLGAEAAVQFEAEQLHMHDHPPQIHLEHEHGEEHDHHIEVKEGHVCSADCPEHGHHHHHESTHEHAHTIEQKVAEHACGADCPEHGQPRADHSHRHEHTEREHDHGHHIEHKAHTCSADCPEHGGQHTHDHREHEHKSHGIEQKAHVCGADCPEHRHTHAHAEHEHQDHRIEAKAHEHRCGPDCPEHGRTHSHGHEHLARAHSDHEPATNPTAEGTVTYRKIEDAVHQSENEQYVARQVVEHKRAHEARFAEETASPVEPLNNEAALHEVRLRRETEIVQDIQNVRSEVEPEVVELVERVGSQEVVTAEAATRIELIDPAEQVELTSPEDETTVPPEVIIEAIYAEIAVPIPETVEPLEDIGLEPATLPLPEIATTEPRLTEGATSARPEEVFETQADLTAHAELPNEIMARPPTMAEATDGLAEIVDQRLEAVIEQITAAAPERAGEIRKTVAYLEQLQAMSANERSAEIIRQQFVHLLRLLGFENPTQSLAAYIHRYGIEFTDELLARLFELLAQGHSFESLTLRTSSPPTTSSQTAGGASALGMLVLALFNLKGYLLPSKAVPVQAM